MNKQDDTTTMDIIIPEDLLPWDNLHVAELEVKKLGPNLFQGCVNGEAIAQPRRKFDTSEQDVKVKAQELLGLIASIRVESDDEIVSRHVKKWGK